MFQYFVTKSSRCWLRVRRRLLCCLAHVFIGCCLAMHRWMEHSDVSRWLSGGDVGIDAHLLLSRTVIDGTCVCPDLERSLACTAAAVRRYRVPPTPHNRQLYPRSTAFRPAVLCPVAYVLCPAGCWPVACALVDFRVAGCRLWVDVC